MASKINKQFIVIIVLVLSLVIALSYIVLDKYTQAKQKEIVNIYQQGIQVGYAQTITTILQKASTCQPFAVYSGNLSLNLVAVECLKQQ